MRLAATLALVLCATLVVAPTGVAAPAAAAAGASADVAAAAVAAPPRHIRYRQWDSGRQLRNAGMRGVEVRSGRLRIAQPAGQRWWGGKRYDWARWTSKWVRPGFGLTEVIPSFSARTPGRTWIEVQLRGRDHDGRRSSWDVLGRWTENQHPIKRHTVSGQHDDLASVNVDTWQVTSSRGLRDFQVRVLLMRPAGGTATPRVDAVGAVASRLPAGRVGTSTPGVARGTRLAVPRYSQMRHSGHYPQWGGGGQAWCSPTATSMVLGYYDALPKPAAYRWVRAGHPDPWVVHAAKHTYDHRYQGTGNWPFNTAYAAPRAGKAFVTRLRSLREAEHFIKAGIPLVASLSWRRGELDNAPISSSNGHLLVIAGFTRSGDVVVNDPAARTRKGVRRVYKRGQFENAWVPKSGGLVYVIRDRATPLPDTSHRNW